MPYFIRKDKNTFQYVSEPGADDHDDGVDAGVLQRAQASEKRLSCKAVSYMFGGGIKDFTLPGKLLYRVYHEQFVCKLSFTPLNGFGSGFFSKVG